jgi:hypothetical protein
MGLIVGRQGAADQRTRERALQYAVFWVACTLSRNTCYDDRDCRI